MQRVADCTLTHLISVCHLQTPHTMATPPQTHSAPGLIGSTLQAAPSGCCLLCYRACTPSPPLQCQVDLSPIISRLVWRAGRQGLSQILPQRHPGPLTLGDGIDMPVCYTPLQCHAHISASQDHTRHAHCQFAGQEGCSITYERPFRSAASPCSHFCPNSWTGQRTAAVHHQGRTAARRQVG